jgi:hypothetical protein
MTITDEIPIRGDLTAKEWNDLRDRYAAFDDPHPEDMTVAPLWIRPGEEGEEDTDQEHEE